METVFTSVTTFWDSLIRDFITYPFMQRILLAVILVSLTCSLLSVFVVLKKMAFIGQGISHAAFGGISLGFWLYPALVVPDIKIYAITIAFCVVVAVLIGFSSRSGTVSEDSAIGIFFVTSMAVGVIFMAMRQNYITEVFNYLFGKVLAVTQEDIYLLGGLAGSVFLLVLLFFKDLYAYCFDEAYADTIGIPTSFLHYLLLILLAMTIVLSVKVVGVILVTAFLVIPGACAQQMTLRFTLMVFLSLLVGFVSALAGILLSNEFVDLPPGTVIVAVQFSFFLLLLLVQKVRLRSRKLQ